jgi:hypothetical protein
MESNRGPSWFAAALLLVALVPTAVIATLYWRSLNDNRAQLEESASRLAMVVTDQQTQIEQLRAELRKRMEGGAEIPAVTPAAESIEVPYGEMPLNSRRAARLKAVLDKLNTENFHGKVRISSFIGDFCLSGNALNGYKLAREDLPAKRCDLIGNPYEDALTTEQREPTEIANLLAAARTESGGKMQTEVLAEGRKPGFSYPSQNEKLTAGEWNRVAARNNRVEIAALSAE